MSQLDSPQPSSLHAAQYTRERRRARSRKRGVEDRRSGGWIRILYFSAASLWGCVVGVAGMSVASARSGGGTGISLATVLLGAAAVAVAGGAVAASAYREARKRRVNP